MNAECLVLPKSLSSRLSEAHGGIYALPKPFSPNRCVDPSTRSTPHSGVPLAQDDRLRDDGWVPLKGRCVPAGDKGERIASYALRIRKRLRHNGF